MSTACLSRFSLSYGMIVFVMVVELGILFSVPVWAWINYDEEEDTVRFRQRLTFTIICVSLFGLVQLKKSQ